MGMTNEEREKHIRIANVLIGAINDSIRPILMYQIEKDVAREALENYVKMLEQQPCEDCISREEAKHFLYERLERLNDDELYDIFSRIIDDMYNELLSVTPSNDAIKEAYIKGYDYGVKDWFKSKTDSDDCISRAEVLEFLKGFEILHNHDELRSNLIYGIMNLPSVTPQQTRWIPCSERLPKENEYIWDVCKYYLVQDEYGDMHVAHLSNVGWIPMDSLKAIGAEIIAWRELPEPYKESEDKR